MCRFKNVKKITACILIAGFGVSSPLTQADQTQKAGDLLQIAIPVIALGTTLAHDQGDRAAGAKQFFQSLATSELTTLALKKITHQRRPNGDCCDSFPSGHTSAAFTGAAFIHKRYGIKYSIPAYAAATFVGYSRVHAKEHRVGDVLAGAAIGTLSSFYFTKPYKGFDISPTVGKDSVGLSLSKSW